MAEDEIVLPDVYFGEHIVDYMRSLGWAAQGAAGAQCFTWQELDAWQRVTGTRLSYWESGAVMVMSSAYVSMLRAGADLNCQAPFMTMEQIENNRGAAEREIRSTLSKFKRKK